MNSPSAQAFFPGCLLSCPSLLCSLKTPPFSLKALKLCSPYLRMQRRLLGFLHTGVLLYSNDCVCFGFQLKDFRLLAWTNWLAHLHLFHSSTPEIIFIFLLCPAFILTHLSTRAISCIVPLIVCPHSNVPICQVRLILYTSLNIIKLDSFVSTVCKHANKWL